MTDPKSACKTVATGGVGESGASTMLTHTVGGPPSKLIVLRNAGTSLCPNTGAVGVITVNGVVVASGTLTAVGSSIQADANTNANVTAIVHTVPLFNSIVCVRLGELSLQLDECDLVGLGNRGDHSEGVCGRPPMATRDWYAWTDRMPPPPDVFHVVGEVQVANPGIEVMLAPRSPQGINPKIILLDLILLQRPGLWIQIPVWKTVRYDKVRAAYEGVEIFSCDQPLVSFPAEVIQ